MVRRQVKLSGWLLWLAGSLMGMWSGLSFGEALASASDPQQRCFPSDFLFGTATAAYQVEGAWNQTARTPSVWDEFCRQNAPQTECADVTDDFAHRFVEDIELMRQMGLGSFRLSISWSRVMTWNASKSRMVGNEPGIVFYHKVLDTLLVKGIEPIVTLYHFDLPAALHRELDPPGWLNGQIMNHFEDFAALAFAEFGNKVKYWATFSDPLSFVVNGYGSGVFPPGITNSETAAYLAAHHVLLSHAQVVQLFRGLRSKQPKVVHRDAKISIALRQEFSFPNDSSNATDVDAAERKNLFELGWFLSPITKGDYPQVMKDRVGERLPQFTANEQQLLRGSYDLFMLNHYSSVSVVNCEAIHGERSCKLLDAGWKRDLGVSKAGFPPNVLRSSKNKWGSHLCEWQGAVPEGYLRSIQWMHEYDRTAPILLTENGFCGNEALANDDQLHFFREFLRQVWLARAKCHINVIGYTVYSLLDSYEWGTFDARFGLFFVNHTAKSRGGLALPQPGDLARIPRRAAQWFARVAHSRCFLDEIAEDDPYQDQSNISPINSTMTARMDTWTMSASASPDSNLQDIVASDTSSPTLETVLTSVFIFAPIAFSVLVGLSALRSRTRLLLIERRSLSSPSGEQTPLLSRLAVSERRLLPTSNSGGYSEVASNRESPRAHRHRTDRDDLI